MNGSPPQVKKDSSPFLSVKTDPSPLSLKNDTHQPLRVKNDSLPSLINDLRTYDLSLSPTYVRIQNNTTFPQVGKPLRYE